MCLILFAYKIHPEFPLVLAANRDEFHVRPALPAGFWQGSADILAGKDLTAGGTWLGINVVSGHLAAITNTRLSMPTETPRSRGELVLDYLKGTAEPSHYLLDVERRANLYQGFNLLAGSAQGLCFLTNQKAGLHELPAGVYGIANRLLDGDCPKIQRGKALLHAVLEQGPTSDSLLSMLADPQVPDDATLSALSGDNLDMQRQLAPCFIKGDEYGTRASTVILMRKNGWVEFVEQTWAAAGIMGNKKNFSFFLPPSPSGQG